MELEWDPWGLCSLSRSRFRIGSVHFAGQVTWLGSQLFQVFFLFLALFTCVCFHMSLSGPFWSAAGATIGEPRLLSPRLRNLSVALPMLCAGSLIARDVRTRWQRPLQKPWGSLWRMATCPLLTNSFHQFSLLFMDFYGYRTKALPFY